MSSSVPLLFVGILEIFEQIKMCIYIYIYVCKQYYCTTLATVAQKSNRDRLSNADSLYSQPSPHKLYTLILELESCSKKTNMLAASNLRSAGSLLTIRYDTIEEFNVESKAEYRKSSDSSRVPDKRRVPDTGRETSCRAYCGNVSNDDVISW